MSLTNAQVVACQLPTTPGATLAVLPALTLPAGVTATGCPTPNGNVTVVFKGAVSIGSGTVNVSGSYLSATNWAIGGSAASLALSSSMNLTAAEVLLCQQPTTPGATLASPPSGGSLPCPVATGAVTAVFAGTVSIGSGTVSVSGSYLGATNWAVSGSVSSLNLSSSVSLESAKVTVCQQPTTPGVTLAALPGTSSALPCAAPTGSITAVFSGRMSIGSGTVSVSGSYLSATNWALSAAANSLDLTSSMRLSNAQVVACQLPTAPGATLAVLPAVTLTAGATALGCPAPTGSVTVLFAGTLSFGSGTVAVSGSYLSATNWAVTGSVSYLALSDTVSLTNAQVTVCQQPTIQGATLASLPAAAAPGASNLSCPAPTGAAVGVFRGSLSVGSGSLLVSGSYANSNNWALAASVNSLAISSTVSLANAQVVICWGASTLPTITLPSGVTRLTCADASISGGTAFTGTLAFGSSSLSVSGTYGGAGTWAMGAAVSSLELPGGISVTGAQVVICQGDATAPTLTLPAGVNAIGCPVSNGGPAAAFAGSIALGASSVSITGAYLGANNWAVVGSLSTLNLTSTLSLDSVQVVLCKQPTDAGMTVATPPSDPYGYGVTNPSCPTATGNVAGAFTGTLSVGTIDVAVTASLSSLKDWKILFTTSIPVGSASLGLAGYVVSTAGSVSARADFWTGALGSTPIYDCTGGTCSPVTPIANRKSAIAIGGGVTFAASGTAALDGYRGFSGVAGTASVSIGSISIEADFWIQSTDSWRLSVDGKSIPIGSLGTMNLRGSIDRSASGTSGSITLSAPTGLTIGPGVVLSGSMTFSYSTATSTPQFSGLMNLSIGGLALNASFAFTNSANWSLTVSAKVGEGGSLTLAPGFDLPISRLAGSITSTAGVITWNLSATRDPVTLVAGVLSLQDIQLSLGSTCDPVSGVAICAPAASGNGYITTRGTLIVNVLSLGEKTVQFAAAYNLRNGAFNLAAAMPSIDIAGFATISNATIRLAYKDTSFAALSDSLSLGSGSGTTGGFAIAISGSVSLTIGGRPAATIDVAMTYMNGGFAIAATFPTGALSLGGDVTGVTLNTVVFLEKAGVVTIGKSDTSAGIDVSVPAKTLVVAGKFVMPDWIASTLGLGSSPTVDMYVTYTSVNQFSLSAAFKQSSINLPNQGSYTFTFTYLTVTVEKSLTGVAVSLRQQGVLGVPATSSRAAFTIPITLSATGAIIGGQTKITFAVSAGCPLAQCPTATPIWSNAMGITGLHLNSLSFSLSITIVPGAPFPLPGIGFSATGTLPASLLSSLGIGAGADLPVSIAFNLDSTNPCIAVTLGTEDGPTFLKLGGVVTASYVNIVVAPNGCTIGEFVVPAGFSLGFKGSFFQVPVVVLATMTLSPFTLDATVQIGDGIEGSPAFKIGSFTVYDTYLRVSIKPGASSAEFRGRITLGSALDVHLKGFFKTDGSFSIDGAIDLKVAGFTLQAKVIASAEAAAKNPKVEVFAYVNIPNVLEVTLSGAFRGYMDMELHGKADFRPGGYKMAALDFDLVLNSSAQYFKAHGFIKIGEIASANMSVALLNQDGSFAFYIYADAQVNLKNIITGDGHFLLTNCSNVDCLDQPGKPNVARLSSTRAHLDASTRWGGFQMGVEVDIDASWGFSATIWLRIDAVTPRVDIAGVDWWAEFHGEFSLTITNLAPYVYGSISFEVSVWNCSGRCSSPNLFLRLGAGLSINPSYFWVTVGKNTYRVNL
jgi:hypothetical protein